MKHTLALILLAVLSWYAPQTWTTGETISWDEAADMTYLPCYSPFPTGPWTALPQTDLLWADVPAPPIGGTFICGQPSLYAPSMPLTAPAPIPSPVRGWGKGGKPK